MYEPPVFCTQCASRLENQAKGPGGKTVPVCPRCGAIHWIDPKLAAGCLVVRENRVLLVRRAIDPGLGKWTFPGGHVDRGETIEEAALRETREECGVHAVIVDLVGLFSYPGRPVAIAVYRAELGSSSPEPFAGDETLEVGWFTPDEVGTLPLAFRSVADSLAKLFGRAIEFRPHGP